MTRTLLSLLLLSAITLFAADNYFLPNGGDLSTPANWSLNAVPTINDIAYFTNIVGSLTLSHSMNNTNALTWGGLVVYCTTGPYTRTGYQFNFGTGKSITITGDVLIGTLPNAGARLNPNAASIFITNDQKNATVYLGRVDSGAVSAAGQLEISGPSTAIIDRVIVYANQPTTSDNPFQGSTTPSGFLHIRNGAHLIGGNIRLATFLQDNATIVRSAGWATAASELLLYNRFILTGTNTLFIHAMSSGGLRPLAHNTAIIISNGATFFGDNSVWESRVIAAGRAWTNSFFHVTHNGSVTTTAGVAVGPSIANNETLSYGNLMLVSDGGSVWCRFGDVGGLTVQNPGGDGRTNLHSAANLAIVTNGGVWNCHSLRVGYVGPTGQFFAVSNNTLIVAAGGLVYTTNAFIGVIHNPAAFYSSTNFGNRIVVHGGTFRVVNSASNAVLFIRNGRLVCRAGIAEVDRLNAIGVPEATVLFEGGTLLINNATTNNTGSPLTVANGTLILAAGNHNFVNGLSIGADGVLKGNGRVIGNVSSSGTIAPGTSIGYLPVVGNVTVADQGIIHWELDTATNDVLNVTGNLTFLGQATLLITNLVSMAPPNEPRTLFTVSGTYSGPSTWNIVAPPGWSVSQISESSGVVSLQMIPEPAGVILPALALLLSRSRKR
ncbi:MAG: hypothetical protein N2595_07360 [bacterium]|nr:hypothetical protein [bacterium]